MAKGEVADGWQHFPSRAPVPTQHMAEEEEEEKFSKSLNPLHPCVLLVVKNAALLKPEHPGMKNQGQNREFISTHPYIKITLKQN